MIKKREGAGRKTYAYRDGRHPHAVTQFGTDTYSYDAAGNMISEVRAGEAITYGYDGFNRMTSLTNALGTTTYVYGAGYERVQKKLPSGKITTYYGDLAEQDELGNWTTHLFLDPLNARMRIATVDSTGTYYNVSDHLGSSSLVLDSDGTVVQKLDYLPFGGERVNIKTGSFDSHFTFTDQEKDAESGLLYYGARPYHPIFIKFFHY